METNKYANGKIYRIVSNVSNKQYIGSTIENLSKRIYAHKHPSNKTSSKVIFQEDGIENCKIILIENYPCLSRDQLLMRERHFIESMDCVNKVCPIRTKEENNDLKNLSNS